MLTIGETLAWNDKPNRRKCLALPRYLRGWRRMGPGRSGRAYSRVCGAATAKGSEHVRVIQRQDPRLPKHLLHRRLQFLQSRHHVRAEVHADRAAVALSQAEEVAECLCRLEHPERVGLAGDRQILRIVGRDLNEDSRVRPTLVQLPGGMEKARTIAERRRHLLLIPHPQPDRLQRLV